MASNTVSNVAKEMSANVRAFAKQHGLSVATPADFANTKAAYLASLPKVEADKGERKDSVPQEYTVLVLRGLNGEPGTVGTFEVIGSALGKRGRQTESSPLTPIMEFAETRVAELADVGEDARIIKILSSALGEE